MINHEDYTDKEIRRLIKNRDILFAGNARGKIYGKLRCWSGRKMKRVNRVFFKSEEDAVENGFRACGHCMGKITGLLRGTLRRASNAQ